MSGLRGSELALVISTCEGIKVRDFAHNLIVEIMRRVPGCTARVGLSRSCSEPMSMPLAWKDARIALDLACQSRSVTVIDYNDVGVAGLLMSIREGTNFQGFVEQAIEGLLKEKSPQRETLLQTLRVFFACNWSQQATARELRTHQKTVAYRLDKIVRMTGLTLAAHEQRVLLYLALRMNDLIG